MATVTTTFRLVDNVSSPLNGISNSISNTTKGFEGMAGKIVAVNSALELMGKAFDVVKKVGSAFGYFLSDASEYENIMSKLATTLGDAKLAQEEFDKLSEVASKTPFNLPDVANASIMLRNVGVEAEKIIPTIRMLGDASLGDREIFNRVLGNYAQIMSVGKASEMDVKQFSNALLPIREEMKKLGIESQPTAEQVTYMFQQMTKEGSKFYKGMEKASLTLTGLTSTLKDDFQKFSNEIGKTLLPTMKNITKVVSDFFKEIQKTEAFERLRKRLTSFFQNIEKNLDSIIATVINVSTIMVTACSAMALAWMVVHWPITLVLASIVVLVTAMSDLTTQANESSIQMTGCFNQISIALANLGGIIGGVGSFIGGLFNIIYNVFATVYNALMTLSEFVGNVLTGHWSVFGSFFIDLASTILNVISTVAGAFDWLFGTSVSQWLNDADEKLQNFKNKNFENTYKYDRLAMKDVSGMASGADAGAKFGAKVGYQADLMLSFLRNGITETTDAEDLEDTVKSMIDANGNVKVSIQNDELKIDKEWAELMQQKAIENYKIKYNQMTPQLKIDNVNVSNETDVETVIANFANSISELAYSDLN